MIAQGCPNNILAVLIESNSGYRLTSLEGRDSLELESAVAPSEVEVGSQPNVTESNLATGSPAAVDAASKYLLYVPGQLAPCMLAAINRSDIVRCRWKPGLEMCPSGGVRFIGPPQGRHSVGLG